MHSFLKAVGFDKIGNIKLEEILSQVVDQPNYMNMAEDSQGNTFVEFSKDFGESIGITVCGGYSENEEFQMDYYYPYFRGSRVTSEENIEIERPTVKAENLTDDEEEEINAEWLELLSGMYF